MEFPEYLLLSPINFSTDYVFIYPANSVKKISPELVEKG